MLCGGGGEEGGSMAASNGLPEDLVIEILSLLPVNSLLRFKCVCKFWRALFENPSFVSKHINNNTIETATILVKRHHDRKDAFLLLSNETLEVYGHLELDYLRDFRKTSLRILGSCYGVICLHEYSKNDIILWNPSTRQSKVVPQSPIPDPPYSNIHYKFGHGYDVKSKDFKVFRFVTFWCTSRIRDAKHRTEVYSLSTNSWRLIDAVAPSGCITIYDWRYVNGILSTLAESSRLDDDVLISFDMRDEVFLLTPLPELCVVTREDGYDRSITVLNESVALFLRGKNLYEIWVLNEYSSNGSWTKLYAIQKPYNEFKYPLGFFWKNSVLFMQTANGGLTLFDLITQEEIKNIQVDEEMRVWDLVSYKESLVRIEGGNHPLYRKRR